MSDPGSIAPDKKKIALGLLTVGLGAVPLLASAGILPSRPQSYESAPAWIGWLIGLMFMGAGALVVIQGLASGNSDGNLPRRTPVLVREAYHAIGLAITLSFGVVLTWVAFGPGPRHFTTTIAIPGMALSTWSGGDWLGRAAFGSCAMLFWAIFAIWLVVIIQRKRQ